MNQQLPVSDFQRSSGRYDEDEIDLMELFVVLWRGRRLVILVSVLSAVVAIGYALITPTQYKLEARVSAPSGMQLAQFVTSTFDPGADGVSGAAASLYSPKELFASALRDMASNSVKREFVADWNSKIADSEEFLDRRWFESALLVGKEIEDKEETGVYQLSIECSEQEYCASLINSYLGFVSARSSEAVSAGLVKLLEADKHRVEDQLARSMRVHNQSIKDRVTKLDSQITVARSMGWELPNEAILASDKPVQPHYQGYKLLEAQKAALLLQIDNPAFASGIRSQEERIRKIGGAAERLSELSKDIQVIGVLDYAYPIDSVVAPKRRLIVIMAVILGGLLGVFAVFVRHGVRSYQARQAEAPKELA